MENSKKRINMKRMNKKGSLLVWITSMMLIGLFMFAMIGFGRQLAIDNNLNNSIMNNPNIEKAYSNLELNFSSAKNDSEIQQTSFFSKVPILGELGLIIEALSGFSRTFFNVVVNFASLPIVLIQETLGVSSVVLGGISAIIMMSLLLLVWQLYRSGR